jgi:hypothetical protein
MQIEFNTQTGKFDGIVDGKVVFSSSNKQYVKTKLRKVTPAFMPQPTKKQEFNINERFSFVEKIVKMVANRATPSCIISGSGGMGKTYSVLKALKDAGMTDVTDLQAFDEGHKVGKQSFRVLKGYTTAKGLFRTLQECNNMTLVLDDFDSALKDPVSLNLLKAALDGYSKRYITWNSDMRDEDLERTFEFKGTIIFITNIPSDKLDQAVRSRCMTVDVSMNKEETIDRMQVIAESEEFLPEIDLAIKKTALSFIKENLDDVANLSLRSLIQITKIVDADPSSYRSLARYVLTQGN